MFGLFTCHGEWKTEISDLQGPLLRVRFKRAKLRFRKQASVKIACPTLWTHSSTNSFSLLFFSSTRILYTPRSDKFLADTASSVAGGSKAGFLRGQVRLDATKQESKGSIPSQREHKAATISFSGDKQGSQGAKITWTEFMSGSILAECQLRFQINFNWEVFEIIHEVLFYLSYNPNQINYIHPFISFRCRLN